MSGSWRVVALPFAGLVVWAIRFAIVYAITHTVCAGAALPGPDIVPIVMLSTAAAAIALDLWIIVFFLRRPYPPETAESARFAGRLAAAIAALSILAIGLETLPAFLLPACS